MILTMSKAICSYCGKEADLWILPNVESGPYWCGEGCRLAAKMEIPDEQIDIKVELEEATDVVNETGSGTSGEGSPAGGEESFENEGNPFIGRSEAGVDDSIG